MIRIDKWAGLVTNASQFAIPPGAAVEQVNLQCLVPGQLTVRAGMQAVALPVGIGAESSVVRAVRYEHGASEQVVFQDAAGNIYSSMVAAAADNPAAARPGRPTLQAVLPGDGKISVTVTAVSGATGYAFQVSTNEGQKWRGAGTFSSTAGTLSYLANGQKYYVRVAAVNASGAGDYTDAFGPVIPVGSKINPASAPPLVTASASAPSSVALLWQSPTQDGGAAITSYTIQSSANAGITWTTASTASATSLTATLTGLSAGTSYIFRVAAVTSAGIGQYSDPTASVSVYGPATPPSAPRSLSAVASATSIALTWQAPELSGSAAVTNYIIQYGAQSATASSTAYTLTGLTANTVYTISVAARSPAGTGAWATLPPVTTQAVASNTVPSAPQALTLAAANGGFVATWAAPATNGGAAVAQYTLSVATTETGSFTQKYQGSATTATVTGLTNGTTYYVRVTASNSVGASAPATGSIMPGQAASAPTALKVSYADTKSGLLGTLSWQAPASLFGVPVTHYEVAYCNPPVENGGALSNWEQVSGSITSSSRSVTIGLTYTWAVRAYTSFGVGAQATISQVVPDPNASPTPSAPLALSVVAGNASVTATWDAPSDPGTAPISSYKLVITGKTAVTVQASSPRKFVFTGLANGTSYIITVTAVNANGAGPPATSNPVTPFALPSAPTGSVLTLGSGYWLVTWNKPASTGGLSILKYGIRTNVGATGPYGGNAGLVAETDGIPVPGSTQLAYVYKSPAPGAYASDGTASGRFDVYAITAAGEGALLSLPVTLPENITPPPVSQPTYPASSGVGGVISNVATAGQTRGDNAMWKPNYCEFQYSYDNVTFYDAPSVPAGETVLYPSIARTSFPFAVAIPYDPAYDTTNKRRYTVTLRVRAWYINTFSSEIPHSPTSWYSRSVVVSYGVSQAPGSPAFSQTGEQWYASWSAPTQDGGLPIAAYSLQVQHPSTCAITTQTLASTARSASVAWDGLATMRWRVGATNAAGTTYTDWQNKLADNESVVGVFTVPGTAGYTSGPLDTGRTLTTKARIFADGQINVGNALPNGPDGRPADGTGRNPGALMSNVGGASWVQTGSCGIVDPAGTNGRLYLSIYDDVPSDNSGSFSVTVIAIGVSISAPRNPEVKVNGSSVWLKALLPADTQGLTITHWRVQSSLNKTTWTTVYDQPKTAGLAYESVVLSNQPAAVVYYRIYAVSNSVASTPAEITKADVVPDAPTGLTAFPSGAYSYDVSWSPPIYDGGPPILGYRIEEAIVPLGVGANFSPGYWRVAGLTDTFPRKELTYTATNSSLVGAFYIRVAAVNAKGVGAYTTQFLGYGPSTVQ